MRFDQIKKEVRKDDHKNSLREGERTSTEREVGEWWWAGGIARTNPQVLSGH